MRERPHDLPPKPDLISGHYFQFYRDQLAFLDRCARECGDLVSLRFFHVPVYVLNSPVLIEEALSTSSLRKPRTVRTFFQKKVFGNGLLSSEGDVWLRQRRLLRQVFDAKHLTGYSEVIVRAAENFAREWDQSSKRILDDDFAKLTLEIAAESFFGASETRDREAVRELAQAFKEISARQSGLSWFADVCGVTTFRSRFNKALSDVNEMVADLIRRRRQKGETAGTGTDLLSLLVNSGMADMQIRDEVVTFFFAGHETTAITLTWLCYLLATHEETYNDLRSEVLSLGAEPLCAANVDRLPLLHGIVKETLRLYPPNRSVARQVVEDFDLNAYHIERGSQLVMPQWVLHRDSRYFDLPHNFKPERWTPEFERRLPRYAYFPFGVGNRACIGRQLAMMEVILITAVIARRFSIAIENQDPVEPEPIILLRPKHKLRATVRTVTNG